MSSSTRVSSSTGLPDDASAAPRGIVPSPWRRTWLRFRQQRLGYWSLMILASLFVLSLLGEVLSKHRPLLEIERYSARFGDKLVVRDLNLSIACGERVALVGESGSGKSVTALSI